MTQITTPQGIVDTFVTPMSPVQGPTATDSLLSALGSLSPNLNRAIDNNNAENFANSFDEAKALDDAQLRDDPKAYSKLLEKRRRGETQDEAKIAGQLEALVGATQIKYKSFLTTQLESREGFDPSDPNGAETFTRDIESKFIEELGLTPETDPKLLAIFSKIKERPNAQAILELRGRRDEHLKFKRNNNYKTIWNEDITRYLDAVEDSGGSVSPDSSRAQFGRMNIDMQRRVASGLITGPEIKEHQLFIINNIISNTDLPYDDARALVDGALDSFSSGDKMTLRHDKTYVKQVKEMFDARLDSTLEKDKRDLAKRNIAKAIAKDDASKEIAKLLQESKGVVSTELKDKINEIALATGDVLWTDSINRSVDDTGDDKFTNDQMVEILDKIDSDKPETYRDALMMTKGASASQRTEILAAYKRSDMSKAIKRSNRGTVSNTVATLQTDLTRLTSLEGSKDVTNSRELLSSYFVYAKPLVSEEYQKNLKNELKKYEDITEDNYQDAIEAARLKTTDYVTSLSEQIREDAKEYITSNGSINDDDKIDVEIKLKDIRESFSNYTKDVKVGEETQEFVEEGSSESFSKPEDNEPVVEIKKIETRVQKLAESIKKSIGTSVEARDAARALTLETTEDFKRWATKPNKTQEEVGEVLEAWEYINQVKLRPISEPEDFNNAPVLTDLLEGRAVTPENLEALFKEVNTYKYQKDSLGGVSINYFSPFQNKHKPARDFEIVYSGSKPSDGQIRFPKDKHGPFGANATSLDKKIRTRIANDLIKQIREAKQYRQEQDASSKLQLQVLRKANPVLLGYRGNPSVIRKMSESGQRFDWASKGTFPKEIEFIAAKFKFEDTKRDSPEKLSNTVMYKVIEGVGLNPNSDNDVAVFMKIQSTLLDESTTQPAYLNPDELKDLKVRAERRAERRLKEPTLAITAWELPYIKNKYDTILRILGRTPAKSNTTGKPSPKR